MPLETYRKFGALKPHHIKILKETLKNGTTFRHIDYQNLSIRQIDLAERREEHLEQLRAMGFLEDASRFDDYAENYRIPVRLVKVVGDFLKKNQRNKK